ncbi:MAG: peptidyl-tRNA hydrolase Pth2 [Candidatus Paceibacterota bacterium]
MKLAIIVRKDLDMSCGKIAGQVGHASVMAYRSGLNNTETTYKWWNDGQKKIILKVPDLPTLERIKETAVLNNLQVHEVIDLGFTQIEPNTLTCIAIGPDEDEKINKVVGGLKLL